MNILDFFGNDNNDYKKPEVSKLSAFYNDVVRQALRHNTRSEYTELYKIARPNEEKEYTDYRENNKRRVTADPINRFKSMLFRSFANTFEEISDEKYPGFEVKKWELLDLSLIDANALALDWPVNERNPLVPPAAPLEEGGLNQNEKVGIREKVIYSDVIVSFFSGEYLLFEEGKKKLDKGVDAPVYKGVDKNSYWLFEPFLNAKKEIRYNVIEWYNHRLSYLPVVELPGIKTISYEQKKEKLYYKETYAFAAYELLDEAIMAFSTDQVNRIRHLSPKMVIIGKVDCPTCNGSKVIGNAKCHTCSGTGKVSSFGDFSTINIDPKAGIFEGNVTIPGQPIYYLQPAGGLEYGKKVWEDFIDKAERALCTDVLEGTGNESGIAKGLRLEPRQDILEAIGSDFIEMCNNLLKIRYALLFEKEAAPVIHTPNSYNSKTVEMLRYEAENSMQAEKFVKFKQYIGQQYKGNELMLKVYDYALLYAPLLLYKHDEAIGVVSSGIYTETDLIKRDYAVYAIKEVLKGEKKELDKKVVFEKADQILIDLGVMEAPIVVDDIPLDTLDNGSELGQTVGGVPGLIGISAAVARGEMTEKAAEGILTTVYKFSVEQARALIDVPKKPETNE